MSLKGDVAIHTLRQHVRSFLTDLNQVGRGMQGIKKNKIIWQFKKSR